MTDASNVGMGAVLEQHINGCWRPLAYFSKTLSDAQRKYSTYDRELLAIVQAIKHFKYFLKPHTFKIMTDHKPLTFMFTQKSDKISDRIQRQIAMISQFSTWIEHIADEKNLVADALSRIELIDLPTEFNLIDLAKAQENDDDVKKLKKSLSTGLKIRDIVFGDEKIKITCDISNNMVRYILPINFRKRVFEIFHFQAHPSAKALYRTFKKKYVWPFMERDIAKWSKGCLNCQASKVGRHIITNPNYFVPPSARFSHVHMDLIGPLGLSDGFQYCLTIIDRFTRWPEAIPIKDKSSESVCRGSYDNWVSRFGVPETVTTDQGKEFESRMTQNLMKFTGCHRIRTTSYHPASNGMVERWHRTLKAAIMCHDGETWSRSLSSVLLGLRTSVLKCGYSPAEYTYGTTLRIPGEFTLSREDIQDRGGFVTEFKEYINRIKPIPVTHNHNRRVFVHKELINSTHVFVRTPPIRKSLERPCSGPHRVIERISDRVYEIEVNGKKKRVSIENIKPAFFPPEEQIQTEQIPGKTIEPSVYEGRKIVKQNKTENKIQNNKQSKNVQNNTDVNKNNTMGNRENTNNDPEIIIPVAINSNNDEEQHVMRKRVRFVQSILRRNKREENPFKLINNQNIPKKVSDAILEQVNGNIQKRQKHVPLILRRRK